MPFAVRCSRRETRATLQNARQTAQQKTRNNSRQKIRGKEMRIWEVLNEWRRRNCSFFACAPAFHSPNNGCSNTKKNKRKQTRCRPTRKKRKKNRSITEIELIKSLNWVYILSQCICFVHKRYIVLFRVRWGHGRGFFFAQIISVRPASSEPKCSIVESMFGCFCDVMWAHQQHAAQCRKHAFFDHFWRP